MNSTLEIDEYIDDFRKGYRENAFCGLTQMSHAVLPELISKFRNESDQHVRVFLVNVIWQYRQQSMIPFLAETLHVPESDIWKEALDGLVTLASAEALEALQSARNRQFPHEHDGVEFRKWIDEAIEQVEAEVKKENAWKSVQL